MKNKKWILIAWFLLAIGSMVNAEKHALIIAVGDYPASSGWNDLGAVNDAVYIKKALQARGFLKTNITILKNQEATKEGILRSLEALKKKVKKGDIIYLHFSGHGQQVLDDNGDELDKLDEAIVPYNSPIDFQKGIYEGEYLIRDDEIGDHTFSLRETIGKEGQLIVVIDACYSGTGTRGRGTTRGTSKIMAPEKVVQKKKEDTFGIAKVMKNNKHLSPMSALFASSAHELNYECRDPKGQSVGTLSYALATILIASEKAITIRELFDRIKLKMAIIAPSQYPQLEGTDQQYLFNLKKFEETVGYDIVEMGSSINLKAAFGILHGIPKGSEVALYSLDQEKVLAHGYVNALSLNFAHVKLNKSVLLKKGELAKIRVVEKAIAIHQCAIQIEINANSFWKGTVEELKQKEFFRLTDKHPDLYLFSCEGDELLELRTPQGDLIYQTNPKKSQKYNTRKITECIQSFNQSNFLRNYEVASPEFNLVLEFIPIKVKETNGELKEVKRLNINNFRTANGDLRFQKGDAVKLKIINKGTKAAYYSLIDIECVHQITLLLPNQEYEYFSADLFIQPNQTQIIDIPFVFNPPFGKNMIKLIATEEPLNLHQIIQSRGLSNHTNSQFHPFEKILNFSFQSAKNRGISSSINLDKEIGVRSFVYEVVE